MNTTLHVLIEQHAPIHHGSEVAWALWGSICLGCQLQASAVEKAIAISDPCVSLCALHAINSGVVMGTVDLSSLATLMNNDELYEDRWLLVYEANIKGWLPNLGGTDFVSTNKYFGPMKAAGVSFYETSATLAVPVKHEPEPSLLSYHDGEDLDFLYAGSALLHSAVSEW